MFFFAVNEAMFATIKQEKIRSDSEKRQKNLEVILRKDKSEHGKSGKVGFKITLPFIIVDD